MEAIARESVRQAAEAALQQAAEAAQRQAALAQEVAARAAITIQMTVTPIRLKLAPQPVTAQDACGMRGWSMEVIAKEPVSVSRRVRMK